MTDPSRTAEELSELRGKVGELEQWRAAEDARREDRDRHEAGRVKLENDFRLELTGDLEKAAESRRRLFEKTERLDVAQASLRTQARLISWFGGAVGGALAAALVAWLLRGFGA